MNEYILKEESSNCDYWNYCDTEDAKEIKKMILSILKERKVSLNAAGYIFRNILEDIKENNPITI